MPAFATRAPVALTTAERGALGSLECGARLNVPLGPSDCRAPTMQAGASPEPLSPPAGSAFAECAFALGLTHAQAARMRLEFRTGRAEDVMDGDVVDDVSAAQRAELASAYYADASRIARGTRAQENARLAAIADLEQPTQAGPFGGVTGVELLSDVPGDTVFNCDGFKLLICSRREVARFLLRLGDLGVVNLVGTSKAPTLWVRGVQYVLIASTPWALYVELSRKDSINSRIARARGLLRESHSTPSCMSPGGDLTMTVGDFVAVLRKEGVDRLYAVLHAIKSSSRLVFDSVDSLLLPACWVGGEFCEVVVDVAVASETGLGEALVEPGVAGWVGGGAPGAQEGTILTVQPSLSPGECVERTQLDVMFALLSPRNAVDLMAWRRNVGATVEHLSGYLRLFLRLRGCRRQVEMVVYSKLMHVLGETAQSVKDPPTPKTIRQLVAQVRVITDCLHRMLDVRRQKLLSGVRAEMWLTGLTSLRNHPTLQHAFEMFARFASEDGGGLFRVVRFSPSRLADSFVPLSKRLMELGLYGATPGTHRPTTRALQLLAVLRNSVGFCTWKIRYRLRTMEPRLVDAILSNAKLHDSRAERLEALACAERAMAERDARELVEELRVDREAAARNAATLHELRVGGLARAQAGANVELARRAAYDEHVADELEAADSDGQRAQHNDPPWLPPVERLGRRHLSHLADHVGRCEPPRTRARSAAPPAGGGSDCDAGDTGADGLRAPDESSVGVRAVVPVSLGMPVPTPGARWAETKAMLVDLFFYLHITSAESDTRFDFRVWHADTSKMAFSAPYVRLLMDKVVHALLDLAAQGDGAPVHWRAHFKGLLIPRTDRDMHELAALELQADNKFPRRRVPQ